MYRQTAGMGIKSLMIPAKTMGMEHSIVTPMASSAEKIKITGASNFGMGLVLTVEGNMVRYVSTYQQKNILTESWPRIRGYK
ncbi:MULTISPECIES: hypothetical protein [unclassified Serratia (in: enterobacteria)]|uniref:hypothetical protein n=1 Tax=Serratia TaxID=613 RepID=UPI001CC02C38|nr:MULTISPECIES: hypothetical protein [unclassified Serratia (in: enterobacteria)]